MDTEASAFYVGDMIRVQGLATAISVTSPRGVEGGYRGSDGGYQHSVRLESRGEVYGGIAVCPPLLRLSLIHI